MFIDRLARSSTCALVGVIFNIIHLTENGAFSVVLNSVRRCSWRLCFDCTKTIFM